MLQVSKNELGAALEKAALGQGFDRGTGLWLAGVVVQALNNGYPALTWAVQALKAAPEPPKTEERPEGWICLNTSVLVAGPVLTDLLMAGEKLDGQGFVKLDVPELWTHLLDGGFESTPGPLRIDEDDWNALQTYAAKTYVPATEQSRQGAGSNSSDRD